MRRILSIVSKWSSIVLIAIVVAAAFLAPVAVIRDGHNETERILMRIQEDSEQDLDRAIRVNVLTISCLLLIEPEERTEADLERCIREGLNSALPGT